ncbi:MAG: hypothetical protein ACERKN_13010 [Velocimicrobium sp.]
MIKRKGKFLTFCFSLIPGAGHMYLGFMKQGISLMTLLCITFFFSTILNMGPLLFILPVLWFYSFFDVLNKNSMQDEDFYKLEDNYFSGMDFSSLSLLIQGKFKKIIAIACIVIGASLLISNFSSGVSYLLIGWEFYGKISYFFDKIPQLVLAVFILFIGIRLIQGKKFELLNHETTEEDTSTTAVDTVLVEQETEDTK